MSARPQERRSLFDELGGESIIRRLVDRFYDLMDQLPQAKGIRGLHPADLGESRDKLFEFLTGWSGGPPLYVQKYGHPRLRMRHMPFPIAEAERDAWMLCMREALADVIEDATLRERLDGQFAHIADFMRNKED